MKRIPIGQPFPLCAALSIIWAALGCIQPVPDCSTATSSGTGGADAGEMCSPFTGPGPTCMGPHTAILEGTIDGQPYSMTYPWVTVAVESFPEGLPPFSAGVHFSFFAGVTIVSYVRSREGRFIPINEGDIKLEMDTDPRMILPGSLYWIECGRQHDIRLVLNVTGGNLTICANE
jgi:hypothetical protein